MAPEQVAEAEGLLRAGTPLTDVCEAVGVSRRTLERAWTTAHGITLGRWMREHVPAAPTAGPSPVVCFR